jgi:PHAX RNA-binding domain
MEGQPTTLPMTTADEVVKAIAQQLGETDAKPLSLLRKLVKKLGSEQALAFLKETLEGEAQGGMRLPDGSCRRTPGSVFFYLVSTKGPTRVRPLFW